MIRCQIHHISLGHTLILTLTLIWLSVCVCVCVKSFNFSHQKIIINLFHLKLFSSSIYLWCDSFFLFFFENFPKSTITNSMKITKNLTKWPATVCVHGIFFIYSMQFSSFAQYSLNITWVLCVFSLFFFCSFSFSSRLLLYNSFHIAVIETAVAILQPKIPLTSSILMGVAIFMVWATWIRRIISMNWFEFAQFLDFKIEGSERIRAIQIWFDLFVNSNFSLFFQCVLLQ